jgi:hypothetical protein
MGEYAIDQMLRDYKRTTGMSADRRDFEGNDTPRNQWPKCMKCGRQFRVPQAVADHMRNKHPSPANEIAMPAAEARDREHGAFENWLAATCPSGDVTEVQRQWERSSARQDLMEAEAARECQRWAALRVWLERSANEYESSDVMSIAESLHRASAMRETIAVMRRLDGA